MRVCTRQVHRRTWRRPNKRWKRIYSEPVFDCLDSTDSPGTRRYTRPSFALGSPYSIRPRLIILQSRSFLLPMTRLSTPTVSSGSCSRLKFRRKLRGSRSIRTNVKEWRSSGMQERTLPDRWGFPYLQSSNFSRGADPLLERCCANSFDPPQEHPVLVLSIPWKVTTVK